jgi:hypothetical protein
MFYIRGALGYLTRALPPSSPSSSSSASSWSTISSPNETMSEPDHSQDYARRSSSSILYQSSPYSSAYGSPRSSVEHMHGTQSLSSSSPRSIHYESLTSELDDHPDFELDYSHHQEQMDTEMMMTDSPMRATAASTAAAAEEPSSQVIAAVARPLAREDDMNHFLNVLNQQLQNHLSAANTVSLFKLPNHVIVEILSYLSLQVSNS